MVGDEPGLAEQLAEPETERRVDPQLALLERFFEEGEALVEEQEAVSSIHHLIQRLKSETRPFTTLTWNWGSGGTS